MPTHSVLPEEEVRQRVRQSLRSGRLPRLRPDQINAGYGNGDTCCACEQVIDPEKIEYEVLAPDTRRKLMFHFACYVIWQRECSEQIHAPSASREPQGEQKRESPPKAPQARREIDLPEGLYLTFA